MSLSSLFFVLCFLPIVTIIYFLTPVAGYKNRLLIFFSLLFYSFGGGGISCFTYDNDSYRVVCGLKDRSCKR